LGSSRNCHSPEHQIIAQFDEVEPDPRLNFLYLWVHLGTHKSVFKRLRAAIRYVFGYRSQYGEWDELLLDIDEVVAVRAFLDEYIENVRQSAQIERIENIE